MGKQLSAEVIRERFDYDPETGIVRNRYSGTDSVRRKKGYVAAQVVVDVRKHELLAHRLAWLCSYGEWPAGPIDHINGIRDDNRLANLRVASPAINSQNIRRPGRNNTTGYLGVSVYAAGRYRAAITVAGKTKWIGAFDDPAVAHQAYLQAKRLHHPGCTI